MKSRDAVNHGSDQGKETQDDAEAEAVGQRAGGDGRCAHENAAVDEGE